MVSNLSTIGFDFRDEDSFRATMARLADEAGERLATADGDYAVWRSRTGAEIWFHLAPAADGLGQPGERVIVGLTPYFEGKSDIAIEVEAIVTRPDDNAMEGALNAWVAPDDLGTGAYPIVFDAVDFAAHKDRELPDVWRARIAGFARELKAYADADAFRAASVGADAGLEAQSFIPIGLFEDAEPGAGNGEAQPPLAGVPQSTALITGRVTEHQRLLNEETGRAFYWLLVESLAATYDVVADPDIVEGDITIGGTIEVACVLFGRILET